MSETLSWFPLLRMWRLYIFTFWLASVFCHPEMAKDRWKNVVKYVTPRRRVPAKPPPVMYKPKSPCGGQATFRGSSKMTFQNPILEIQDVRCEWQLSGPCEWKMQCDKFDLGDDSCTNSLQIFNSSDNYVYCGSSKPEGVTFHDSTLEVHYISHNAKAQPSFSCTIECVELPNFQIQSASLSPDDSESYDCDCGDVSVLTKIVNGRIIRENIYPWMAAIAYKTAKLPMCAGVLINNQYILTAAHCLDYAKASDVEVRLMNYNEDTTAWAPSVVSDVDEILQHPGYTYYMDYDVALLKLKSQVPLQASKIWNICLPKSTHVGREWTGFQGIIAGWGRTSTDGLQSQQLQHSNMTIISREECVNMYQDPEALTPSMMCAQGRATNICQGDSGGPLMSKLDGMDQFTVIGLASWLSQQGCEAKPGVFAKVPEALAWIRETVGDAKACRNAKKEHALLNE